MREKIWLRAAPALMAGAFAVMTGCLGTPEGAHVDPALSILVPADAELLMGIHLEALWDNPLFEKYLSARVMPMLSDLTRESFIDPREDLWEALLVSNGEHFAVLVRGDFSDGIDPWTEMQKEGVPIFAYHGYTFAGDEERSILFLNPSVAGVGATEMLKAMIDARDQTNGPPEVLTAQMQQIPYESPIWIAASGDILHFQMPERPEESEPGPNPLGGLSNTLPNVGEVMGMVKAGRLYTDLSLGLGVHATADTASDADAKKLHDAIRAAAGLARLMTPQDQPALLKVYDGLQITQDASAVNVHLTIPEESIDALFQMANRIAPAPAQ